MVAEITATKPLRSHFDFILAQNGQTGIGLRGIARPVIYRRLPTVAPADPNPPPSNAVTLHGYVLTLAGWPLTIGS